MIFLRANRVRLRLDQNLMAEIQRELGNARSDEERGLLLEVYTALSPNRIKGRGPDDSWVARFVRSILRLFPT